MIFATVCIGEDRRSDLYHLLNDLRNLSFKVYVLTNINIDTINFQFENIVIIKTDLNFYHDFYRYQLVKTIFENENTDYVYYLDCDARFIDFRNEKFNNEKFIKLIESKKFDILNAWMCDNVKLFFEKPDVNENKNIRQFKYGYEILKTWFEENYPNYNNLMHLNNTWEGHLIFKKSEKLNIFLTKIIDIGNLLIDADIANNRKEIACTSSALITLLSNLVGLDLKTDKITHHFFKCNFLREIFPFNFKIDKNEKIFSNNDILL